MLRHTVSALTKLLFPTKCRACGGLFHSGLQEPSGSAEDENGFGAVMSPFLCPECRGGFRPVTSPKCPVCGEIFISREGGDHLCGSCIASPRKFTRARAVGIYDRGLLKAIHCLKYRARIELARPLGRLLFLEFRRQWPENDIDLVVPVPMHGRRMRKRGFNQSLLLLLRWPDYLTAAGGPNRRVRIDSEPIRRSSQAPPQTGLGRAQRLKNLRGAFTIPLPGAVREKSVLLVDDVYTTGATADACAAALMAAGAARVDVLTLARTVEK